MKTTTLMQCTKRNFNRVHRHSKKEHQLKISSKLDFFYFAKCRQIYVFFLQDYLSSVKIDHVNAMHKKNCRECTDILKKGHQFKISSQVCLWGIICTTIKIYESPSIVLVELTAFYLVLQSSTSTILHCKYILLSNTLKVQ